MEPVGSLNSLVDYGGLGDSDIEDSDEEATKEEVIAIVARLQSPLWKQVSSAWAEICNGNAVVRFGGKEEEMSGTFISSR